MSRLIDADKLERQEYWGNERCFDYVDAEDIDNAPTVDAVPVVRCKDCDGGQVSDDGKYVICCRLGISTAFWDFCSYGERKGKNETERT